MDNVTADDLVRAIQNNTLENLAKQLEMSVYPLTPYDFDQWEAVTIFDIANLIKLPPPARNTATGATYDIIADYQRSEGE